ncbi:GNAT family N-acetyltransferase [Promicromonospora soli]|uniref:N-acetyltransferase n=1 Tax=Promicromonospora soli TaxID=2035533 RepID=A0A919FGS2_9MICO|nr:GNAT family N-acetyltransferase [Promicromonospora soli]GHH65276.1 N-acetyltransferase [Promicromonospora soli]
MTTYDTWTVAPEPFDSPDAAALWRECYTHMSDSWYLLKEDRRTDPHELEREIAANPGTELAAPGGSLVVARHDGAAAGMAGVRLLDDERAELKRVYLRPAFRGTGGAALIVRAAEDQARLLGASRMVLETRSDFVAARALYKRLGYDEIEPYTFTPYSEHWFGKEL